MSAQLTSEQASHSRAVPAYSLPGAQVRSLLGAADLKTRKFRASSLPVKSCVPQSKPESRVRVARSVSFSDPIVVDAFHRPVHPEHTLPLPGTDLMSASASARTTRDASYDGLTLTLPKHEIDESINHFPRWQMRQGSDASAASVPSHHALSAGLLGAPPTSLPPTSEPRLSATSQADLATNDLFPTVLSRPTPSPSSESNASHLSGLSTMYDAPHYATMDARSASAYSESVTSPRHSYASNRNSQMEDMSSDRQTTVSASAPVHPLPYAGNPAPRDDPATEAPYQREQALSRASQLTSNTSNTSYRSSGSRGSYAAHMARNSAAVSVASHATGAPVQDIPSRRSSAMSAAPGSYAASARQSRNASAVSAASNAVTASTGHDTDHTRRHDDQEELEISLGGAHPATSHAGPAATRSAQGSVESGYGVDLLGTGTHMRPAEQRTTMGSSVGQRSSVYDKRSDVNMSQGSMAAPLLDVRGEPSFSGGISGQRSVAASLGKLSASGSVSRSSAEGRADPAVSAGAAAREVPLASWGTAGLSAESSNTWLQTQGYTSQADDADVSGAGSRRTSTFSALSSASRRATPAPTSWARLAAEIEAKAADDDDDQLSQTSGTSGGRTAAAALSFEDHDVFEHTHAAELAANRSRSKSSASTASAVGSLLGKFNAAYGSNTESELQHGSESARKLSTTSRVSGVYSADSRSVPAGSNRSALSRDDLHGAGMSGPAVAAAAALSPRSSLLNSGASGGPPDLFTPRTSEPNYYVGEERDPLLADATALEEDLTAVMKRLPASLRYGARDAGADLVSTALLQQLYNRLSRLQAALRQREAEIRNTTRQLNDVKARLLDAEGHEADLEHSLLDATQQLAIRDQEMLALQHRLMEAERKVLDVSTRAVVGVAHSHFSRSEGGAAHATATVEVTALKAALETAKQTLAQRDAQLSEATTRLAERDRELREAAHVLRASERELASQLQTAAARLLPGAHLSEDPATAAALVDMGEGEELKSRLTSATSGLSHTSAPAVQHQRVRELEVQVHDLKLKLEQAQRSARKTSDVLLQQSSLVSQQQFRSARTTEHAFSTNISASKASQSVTECLEQELKVLSKELSGHQETLATVKADAEHAKKVAASERASREQLESLASRLREDVARAQDEAARLALELDSARSAQTKAMVEDSISHLSAYVDKRSHSAKTDMSEKIITEDRSMTTTDIVSKVDLPHDMSNQLAIVAMADIMGTGGIPVVLANQWRKSLAQERGERQELAGCLEVARADLASLKQQLLKTHNAHAAEISDATHRLQQLERHLKDAQARLNSAELRIKELSEESHTLRMTHASTSDELSLERDACRRLRLQVSVTQGSIDVLQKALTSARADLQEARAQQLADALAAQTLSRQVEELGVDAASRLRAAEDAADRLARAQLERLLELRAHPYLDDRRALVIATVPGTQVSLEQRLVSQGRLSRKSISDLLNGPELNEAPQAPPASPETTLSTASTMPLIAVAPDTAISPVGRVSQLSSTHSVAILAVPSSRRSTAASLSSAGSAHTLPGPVPADVEWHAGLEVLQRHLQLQSDVDAEEATHAGTFHEVAAHDARGTRSARSTMNPSLGGGGPLLPTVVEESSPARTSLASVSQASARTTANPSDAQPTPRTTTGSLGALPLVPLEPSEHAESGTAAGQQLLQHSARTTGASVGADANSMVAPSARHSAASSQASRSGSTGGKGGAGSRRASLAASADAAVAALRKLSEARTARTSVASSEASVPASTSLPMMSGDDGRSESLESRKPSLQVRQYSESTGGYLSAIAASMETSSSAPPRADDRSSRFASMPGALNVTSADDAGFVMPYGVVPVAGSGRASVRLPAGSSQGGVSTLALTQAALQGAVGVPTQAQEFDQRFGSA